MTTIAEAVQPRQTEARDTATWYPTMRLFRQVSGGDWRGILNAMAKKLKSMTHRGRRVQ
jgi:hypothetical protein